MVKVVEQAMGGSALTPESSVFTADNSPFCEPTFLPASPGKLTVISGARVPVQEAEQTGGLSRPFLPPTRLMWDRGQALRSGTLRLRVRQNERGAGRG